MRCVWSLLLMLLPGALCAGPWMRAEGSVFLSFGAAARQSGPQPSVFLEYGLKQRVTLGLDGFVDPETEEGRAAAFVRVPLGDPAAGSPASLSLGLGLDHAGAMAAADPFVRMGLAVGRGLPRGWLSAEGAIIAVGGQAQREGKLDVTYGFNIDDRWTSVLQLQSGLGDDGSAYAKLAPSVVLRLSDALRVELGATAPLTGDADASLRLGTWWEF